jgi:hypothetical protein
MTQDKTDDIDIDELASAVAEKLDTGKLSDDRWLLSRRQLAAIAGSGLGAGALSALGIDEASAQTSGQAGTIGTPSQRVDANIQDLDVSGSAGSLNTDDISNSGTIQTEVLDITEQSAAEVSFQGDVSLTAGNFKKLPFDQSTVDSRGELNSTNNTVKVDNGGIYQISAVITFESANANDFVTAVAQTRAGLRLAFVSEQVVGTLQHAISFNTVVGIASGDEIEIIARNNNNSCVVKGISSRTFMTVIRLA